MELALRLVLRLRGFMCHVLPLLVSLVVQPKQFLMLLLRTQIFELPFEAAIVLVLELPIQVFVSQLQLVLVFLADPDLLEQL